MDENCFHQDWENTGYQLKDLDGNGLPKFVSNDYEVKGMLAAYLADKYLLDQAQDGWQRVQQAYQGSDRQQFFTQLRQFLQKGGYASK